MCNFVVLSVLSGADDLKAFEPRQLQALVRLLSGAKMSGFLIATLFLCLGSAIYCYLLARSRYIPRALVLSGVAASALGVLFALACMLFPAFVAPAVAAVRALPAIALAALAVILLPLLSFEVILGLWLLVKGVRIPEHLERRHELN